MESAIKNTCPSVGQAIEKANDNAAVHKAKTSYKELADQLPGPNFNHLELQRLRSEALRAFTLVLRNTMAG